VNIRKLKFEEYDMLKDVFEGFVPPKNSIAMIAEDEGRIVGRVFLVEPVHVEGPWVAESHRGGTVGARLMQSAEKQLKEIGLSKVMAFGSDEVLENYLQRLGYKRLDLSVWEKEL
jgi:predicted N-acetyltransferase YhbS